MNLRDRAWREQIREMIVRLDARMEQGDLEWEPLALLRTVRDRLAGTLGAEEGWTSTPELRRRAAADYAEAAHLLGEEAPALAIPAGDPPEKVLARDFASYRPAAPKRGDRT